MVNDPDFIEPPRTDGDLVELRIVVHGVGMHPVPTGGATGTSTCTGADLCVVDVDAVGEVGGLAVVGQVGADILDEVVPCMPFPNDIASGWKRRCDFSDGLRPNGLGIQPPGSCSFVRVFPFPCEDQDMAIGHPGKIVVVVQFVVRPSQGPQQVAFP